MQVTEVFRSAKIWPPIIVPQQQHAKVIISHIRREVIADNAFGTHIGLSIENIGFQYFNQWQGITAIADTKIHRDRDNFKLNGITITLGVIPVRQGIETVIYHSQGIAQVLLATITPGQVSEIGSDPCIFGGLIVLVKRNAFNRK
ncbi:hypothetical protein P308_27770 [Pseudomonas piscis]|nr:hypothetical protein P308_27770 [Pseudomonas piscis]